MVLLCFVVVLPFNSILSLFSSSSLSLLFFLQGLSLPTSTLGGSGYFDLCVSADDLLANAHAPLDAPGGYWHIIGMEHPHDENTHYIHHFVVDGFYESSTCDEKTPYSFMYEYGPGVEARQMPEV